MMASVIHFFCCVRLEAADGFRPSIVLACFIPAKVQQKVTRRKQNFSDIST